MRKVVFGLLWFVAFYFLGCIVAGTIYSLFHPELYDLPPEAINQIGREIARQSGHIIYPIVIGAAVTLSIAGSAFGVLPGTRGRHQAY